LPTRPGGTVSLIYHHCQRKRASAPVASSSPPSPPSPSHLPMHSPRQLHGPPPRGLS
jgi:hypothetical protein